MISMKLVIKTTVLFTFISSISLGQQNLFNIPSGDITKSKKFFYQHQLNIYSKNLESKAHTVFGFGKGWDGGINLVGKGFYFSPNWRIKYNDDTKKGSLYPILMATVQKQFNINTHFDINFGLQIGYNLSNKIQNKELNYFTYGIGVYHFMEHKSRIVGGIYKANQIYIGEGNNFGAMLGYEINLSKRWYLMGDWLSGSNDASVTVIGGMYNISKRLQLCGGWQVPNPNTSKPAGVVLELNFMTWDLY
jgi:hypothetical protein